MLPLQSAAPRPYQRPSRSVSSNTGALPGGAARVERRLDVVVAVQQHRGRAIGGGDVPVDGGMAVRGFLKAHLLQAGLGELLDHELRRLGALRGGELARIGHGLAGDQRR